MSRPLDCFTRQREKVSKLKPLFLLLLDLANLNEPPFTNYAEMRRKTLYAIAFASLICWIVLIQYLFSERLQKKVRPMNIVHRLASLSSCLLVN